MIKPHLQDRFLSGIATTLILVGFLAAALADAGDGERASESPLSITHSSNTFASTPAKPLIWAGCEYDIETGIALLMNLIKDDKSDSNERALALMVLSRVKTGLRGHQCLRELAIRFDASTGLEKLIILSCFRASGDPLGLSLYSRVLGEEIDLKHRFRAASGLADWNIRRGVAELVQLLDSDEPMPQPSQLFYVRDNAMRTFRLTNIRKGWGFPDDKESAEWPPDVSPPPEIAARWKPRPTAEEIKDWWAENEHRFPDWKPGDPLPEVGEPTEVPKSDGSEPVEIPTPTP